MTTTLAPPPAPRLSPEWQDWLAGNIVRGCSDADLMKVMRENSFDEHYSRVAISVVRSMTERVQASPGAMLTDYQADPLRLPLANRVRAADREVAIGFTLVNPNVGLVIDLLSEQECEKLIQLSSGKLRRSEVVDRASGRLEVSSVRTSEGTHFARGENAVVERLEKRIEALIGIAVDHGEPFQILHYESAGEYLPHHDYFEPADPGSAEHLKSGGQRVATLIIYLNDVEGGGETIFPELELSVKPRRGCAVYFEYCNKGGQLDPRCLHGGTPVTRGEKWIATKWLRQGPYFRP
jgi:prolyl 4-hydroxylase